MKEKNYTNINQSIALFLIRFWLGIRVLISGIEKFSGTVSGDQPVTIDGDKNSYGLTEATSSKTYGLEFYSGIPDSLKTKFAGEPLLPEWMLAPFNLVLGPLLIVLGITILLGIFTRISLFVLGLVFTALTVGLVLIKQDAGVAWLGIHIILIATALFYSDKDRLVLLKSRK